MGKLIELIAKWILKGELTDLNNKINTLTEQINRIQSSSKFEIPKILGSISLIETRIKLSKYCSLDKIFLSDLNYSTTSKEEGIKYTLQSKIDTEKYIESAHDCDNFSFALNGYWSDSLYSFCFGIAWSNLHAFNIMIDNVGQIWIIEPQNNTWTKIENTQDNKMYSPIKLIVI